MKNILITIFFLFASSFNLVFGQGWIKDYGNREFDFFSDIIETEDQGYLAVGRSRNSMDILEIILTKTDIDGNELWTEYFGEPNTHLIGHNLLNTDDGGTIILGSIEVIGTEEIDIILLKTDDQGVIEWTKILDYGERDAPFGIVHGIGGGFLFANQSNNTDDLFVKVNNTGEEEWNYQIPSLFSSGFHPPTFTVLADGYLLTGKTKFAKVDQAGNEIWTKDHTMNFGNTILLSDGNFLQIVGLGSSEFSGTLTKRSSTNGEEIWSNTIEISSGGNIDMIPIVETEDGGFLIEDISVWTKLIKTDSLGNEIFQKDIGNSLNTQKFIVDSSGKLVFTGGSPDDNLGDWYGFIMKTSSDGDLYSNHIQGNVFKDDNVNCIFEEGAEDGFPNRIVKIEGAKTFYGTTDEIGNYDILVDTGNYEVKVILPNPYWNTCDPQPISITEFHSDTIIDLGIQALIDCPWLTVDVGTPFLRRCFENNYTVHYCNDGTTSAEDAYIEVNFDQFLAVQSSTLPWTMQMGNTYTFDVGTLDPGDCGSFNITTLVNCDSTVLGQTHCAQAHIFPDSICLPDAANWDGSSIAVEAECDGDSVHFIIRNIGDGNMASPLSYIIIEDEIMVHQDNFQLNSGESQMIPNGFSNGGSTYRIIAEQSEGHPGNSMPTAAIEGCGTTIFPFGFFNMFSQNDGEIFLSIDCQENIGSYDPNDKQAFPTGFGDEHFIWQNVDLEYQIRFQNTGTDTAFTVVIRDTISEHLDITSLQMGASSHNYTYTIDGEGVLKVRFDHILLPDSTTNLLGSNGFFKYKIKQEPDNSIGTMIYNEAAIYFDFNAPIITNETYHEVGEPFFGMTVSTDDLTTNNIKLNVFPNPFGAFTTFEIENLPAGETAFLLYDNVGRLVRKEVVGDDAQFQFYREGLSSGLYFYEFRQAGVSVASGKMVAE